MASITVRNLDDSLKRRLRIRAAENGKVHGTRGEGHSESSVGRGGGPCQKPWNRDSRIVQTLRRRGVGDPGQGSNA